MIASILLTGIMTPPLTLEQYAISLERRTVSSTFSPILILRALIAWALAASRQSRTHSLAEVCMTPPPLLPGERDRNWGGSPIILPSQSSTIVSSSVQDGAAAFKEYYCVEFELSGVERLLLRLFYF